MRAFATAVVLACGATVAMAQADFDWRGRLTPGQTLEIKGINGDVHATASGSGDAEVHATKSANRSDPAGVRIVVVPHGGGVTVCAVYPDVPGRDPNSCEVGPNSHSNTKDNDTVVRFDVRVPSGVKFNGRTVNGEVLAESLDADAEAHTVNGSVKLSTSGTARASTVNGSLDITMGRAEWPDGAKFSTVNGGITLRVPSFLSAHLKASVLNGSIESDLPITVTGAVSRRKVEGTIGGGAQDLQVSTVNGSIRLKTN
jgi:putative adhesin